MSDETITLGLAGDVMIGRGIDQLLPDPVDPQLHERSVRDARRYLELAERASGELPERVDLEYIWGSLPEELDEFGVDASIINLETSVTRSDDDWRDKGIHYRVSPENARTLDIAGWDVCSLANNHVIDWGFDGLEETLATLETMEIQSCGAGRTLEAATRPASVEFDKVRTPADSNESGAPRLLVFGLAATDAGVPKAWSAGESSPGIPVLEDFSETTMRAVAEWIEQHAGPSDLVVVSIHWGGNWGWSVSDAHRRFAHWLIDEAGVDLVHGHSSHHIKGFEVYDGRLVIYGCGDLLTDYEGISGHESYRGELSCLYLPTLEVGTGRLTDLRFRPTKVHRCQLTVPLPEDIEWIRQTLQDQSNLPVRNIDGEPVQLMLED